MKRSLRIFAIATSALVGMNAFAAEDPTSSTAVVAAVREFAASLTAAEREEFRQARREDLAIFHIGAGSRIRERYFRGEHSDVMKAFCPVPDPNEAYCYPDNASDAMIVKVWELVRSEG